MKLRGENIFTVNLLLWRKLDYAHNYTMLLMTCSLYERLHHNAI